MSVTAGKSFTVTQHNDDTDSSMLYHYCDAYALESIIRNNEIWLSPFVYSNDTNEGRACREALRKLAAETNLSSASLDGFFSFVEASGEALGCYGLSLSERGDVLSQWRGYAADGAGFAIGFDDKKLDALPAVYTRDPDEVPSGPELKLHKVEYDPEASVERLRSLFNSLRGHIEARYEGAHGPHDEVPIGCPKRTAAHYAIISTLLRDTGTLFSIKGPAFEEEHEWRLSAAVLANAPVFKYRVSRGMLVPYIPYALPNLKSGMNPISEVVIGPRNPTNKRVVEMLLRQHGLDVKVRHSIATYR